MSGPQETIAVRVIECPFVVSGETGEPRAIEHVGKRVIQLSLQTAFHRAARDAVGEVWANRRRAIGELRGSGLTLLAAGTHPVLDWRLVESDGASSYPERRCRLGLMIVEFQIAVGVSDLALEEAALVSTALAASSPYFTGRDTGYQSCVSQIFGELFGTAFEPATRRAGGGQASSFGVCDPRIAAARGVRLRPFGRSSPSIGHLRLDMMPDLDRMERMLVFLQHLIGRSFDEHGVPMAWASDNPLAACENYWRVTKYGLDAMLQTRAEPVSLRALLGQRALGAEGILGALSEWPSHADIQRSHVRARLEAGFPLSSGLADSVFRIIEDTARAPSWEVACR